MLFALFPLLIALAILLPAVLIGRLMGRLHPQWWRITVVRSLVWALPALGLISLLIGQWAPRLGYDPTQTPLTALIALALFTELAILVGLPLSAAFARSRRRFLRHGAAASVHVVLAGGTASAIAGTMNGARVRLLPMYFRNLPTHLQGLRILHLSDLHMGTFMTLPELAATLDRAKGYAPHIVLLTGDIADDLGLLPATMGMISELDAPLGIFSCLGNHEYDAGVDQARDLLNSSPGMLLRNFGLPLTWNGGDFFLAGVDDPQGRPAGQSGANYVREGLTFALERRRPWHFTILMAHRPWVFDMSSPRGVELTLAGHTHGGQVGFAGRSILELDPRVRYPRGHYRRGDRQLYTSAGAGQWIPFRLGCPAEAPVIELWRTKREAAGSGGPPA